MTRLLFILLFSCQLVMAGALPQTVSQAVARGDFAIAQRMIRALLVDSALPAADAWALSFENDRLDRIRRDFSLSREEVMTKLKKYYPDLTDHQLDDLEKARSLEFMVIDGQKRYFDSAVPNLFLIDPEARRRKEAVDGPSRNRLEEFLSHHVPAILTESRSSTSHRVNPVRMKLHYTVTVKADAVPDGEIIRCWLPYPREDHSRQTDVRLISVNTPEYIISGSEHPQRTIYLEQRCVQGKPTIFVLDVAFTSFAETHEIFGEGKEKGDAHRDQIYAEYTAERPPHIRFTDEIKALSRSIVGEEQDPLKKARLIFAWLSRNVPWASAREYSTIPDLSTYCAENRHGDCGIQTMLFMTLCRLNGIPAKWQSGWMLHPVDVNLHDWGEIYVDGIGWVPADQSFGLQNSGDERVQYFYLGGIDSYRMIVNDDFDVPLYPAKIYPRSETVDFQRGEVEWRGGNLYFDKWRYKMGVEYRTPNQK